MPQKFCKCDWQEHEGESDQGEDITGMKGHYGCARYKVQHESRDQENALSMILTEPI